MQSATGGHNAPQVIEELEELMQSSPDPEADPDGDEEEEEEEEEETEADADSGSGGMEPILLRDLHTFSPTFNNNCSHEGTASKTQASPFLGEIPTKLGKQISRFQGWLDPVFKHCLARRGLL